jgi:hypothetical protein
VNDGSFDYPLLRPGTAVHVNAACPGREDCFVLPFHMGRVIQDPARLAVPHQVLVRAIHSGDEFEVLRTSIRFPYAGLHGPILPMLEPGTTVFVKRNPEVLCSRCATADDFIQAAIVEDSATRGSASESNRDRIVVVEYANDMHYLATRHYVLRSEIVVTLAYVDSKRDKK